MVFSIYYTTDSGTLL